MKMSKTNSRKSRMRPSRQSFARLGDPELATVYDAMCEPDRSVDGVSRRRFLQGALALGGASLVGPSILAEAADAAPLGPGENILVVIMLAGGNDGLNTVAPLARAKYYDLRGPLALSATEAHGIGNGMALHPNLPKLKQRFDQGDVAIVQGIGNPADDHSHFSSMAQWMSGKLSGPVSSGWLGRYLDAVGGSLSGITVGDSGIPLHLRGDSIQPIGLPTYGELYGSSTGDPWEVVAYEAIQAMATADHGKGPWAQATASVFAKAIDTAQTVQPVYSPELPENVSDPVVDLTIAARLINLNVGARVLNVGFGSFDTHDDQTAEHDRRMQELDDGIDAFFATLAPAYRDRVTVMTFSEFGRRAAANDSGGTDHGSASNAFVIGSQVRGGFHGTHPNLNRLTSRGDLEASMDFRSYYASILERWLGADANQILGGSYEQLDLFTTEVDKRTRIDYGGDGKVVVWSGGQWVVVDDDALAPAGVAPAAPDPAGPGQKGKALAPPAPRPVPVEAPVTPSGQADAIRRGMLSADSRRRALPDLDRREALLRFSLPQRP